MEIRGPAAKIVSFVKPYSSPAKLTTFSAKFEHTREFFRDRRSVLWRTPLYALSFFTVGEAPPLIGGAYAFYRLITMKKEDPGNWAKPLYAAMAANGAVPLAPLTLEMHSETLRTLSAAAGIPEVVPVEPLAIFVGLPILMGISRYIYSLCASGKVVRDLAAAAVADDARNVAGNFLTAQKRIDRKIVLKTMREIKNRDAAKFVEIYTAMQAAEACGKRAQKLLARLKLLAEEE